MKHKYLVGMKNREFEERDFKIVSAQSEEDAIVKFLHNRLEDEPHFKEYLYDKSVNMSFAERFWLQSREEQERFSRNEGQLSINEDDFEKRARQFFAERTDFANLYLNFYYSDDEVPPAGGEFPTEMLVYIWLKNGNENILVIPIEDIPEIS